MLSGTLDTHVPVPLDGVKPNTGTRSLGIACSNLCVNILYKYSKGI